MLEVTVALIKFSGYHKSRLLECRDFYKGKVKNYRCLN